MSGLDSIITVVISRQTSGVTAVGFGIPLILGPNAAFTGAVRTYSSLSAVAVDFATSTDEYKAALAMFSQTPSPTAVKIAKRQSTVAGVFTITPTVVNSFLYSVIINGVTYSTTSGGSATASAIVSALSTLINADSSCTMAATGSTTLILTGTNAGQANTVTVGTNLAVVTTTAKVGAADDILLYDNLDSGWYCLILTSRTLIDQMDAAAQIETMKRIFIACSSTSAIYSSSSTTDVAYLLAAKTYKRTALLYSGDVANFPDAAWAGQMLPTAPGSENWAFKTLVGNVADSLTDTQTAALDTKFVNYYIKRGGVSITTHGYVVGNDYIDITRGIDWLYSTIQTNIYSKLTSMLKIPLTDKGIAVVETQLRGALQAGVDSGFLASYSVTVPLASSLTSSQKASRTLAGLSFVAVAAGAIDSMTINGIVTL